MSLDVDSPEPPELAAVDPNEYEDAEVAGGEYRRDDLEALLHEGAWEDAFSEWSDTTDMDEEDWAIAVDLGLVSRFDFFWDDFADRVGYHALAPRRLEGARPPPRSRLVGTVSAINAGLTELGQIVCETLKEEYIDWEADFEAPDDLPDFEE